MKSLLLLITLLACALARRPRRHRRTHSSSLDSYELVRGWDKCKERLGKAHKIHQLQREQLRIILNEMDVLEKEKAELEKIVDELRLRVVQLETPPSIAPVTSIAVVPVTSIAVIPLSSIAVIPVSSIAVVPVSSIAVVPTSPATQSSEPIVSFTQPTLTDQSSSVQTTDQLTSTEITSSSLETTTTQPAVTSSSI